MKHLIKFYKTDHNYILGAVALFLTVYVAVTLWYDWTINGIVIKALFLFGFLFYNVRNYQIAKNNPEQLSDKEYKEKKAAEEEIKDN